MTHRLIALTCLTLLATAAAAQRSPRPNDLFLAQARVHLLEHPENEGLGLLVSGTDLLMGRITRAEQAALNQVLHAGWTGSSSDVVQGLLIAHAAALGYAALAAEAEEFNPFPIGAVFYPAFTVTGRIRVPRGSTEFAPVQLCQLLLADARRLQSVGQVLPAVDRSLQGMRLSRRLAATGTDPNLWSSAISALSQGLTVLSDLVGREALPAATVQEVRSELETLDLESLSVSGVNAGIIDARATLLRRAARDAGLQGRLRRSMRQLRLRDQIREIDEDLHIGHDAFWEEMAELAATLDGPPTQWSDDVWAPDGTPIFRQGLLETAVHLNIARARHAICLAQCALALGDGSAAAELNDPFSGEGLRITPERVYSFGPDGDDDGGAIPYVITERHRLLTDGDLVSPR